MISTQIGSNPEDKYELFLGDYIGMFILLAPLIGLFIFFSFYVVEIIYLRNYKKPLVVFANISFRDLNDNQKQILDNNFHFYNRLKPRYKRYFEHRVAKFMSNYEFVGKDISVTDEMRVTISATYVMLTFGMREYLNPLFKTIVIFPDIYYSSQTENYHKGEFNPRLKNIAFSYFKPIKKTSITSFSMNVNRFQNALQRIDAANAKDPNKVVIDDTIVAKELLYSDRMLNRLMDFAPDASEAIQIAAKGQHICRWEIARNTYPMDRVGYLKWREALKKFHASKTTSILKEVGYENAFIDRVCFLIEKKLLKKDAETQLLEDVICLVFLEYYLEEFILKHDTEKLKNIIIKTWNKMSEKGQKTALTLSFSTASLQLIKEALDL